jgi:hypothetical protein
MGFIWHLKQETGDVVQFKNTKIKECIANTDNGVRYFAFTLNGNVDNSKNENIIFDLPTIKLEDNLNCEHLLLSGSLDTNSFDVSCRSLQIETSVYSYYNLSGSTIDAFILKINDNDLMFCDVNDFIPSLTNSLETDIILKNNEYENNYILDDNGEISNEGID